MFFRKKKNHNQLDIEKQLFDRELELYRREKYQKLNEEIENQKLERLKEVAKLEIACHRQLAQYEHEFHSTKEEIENSKIKRLKQVAEIEIACHNQLAQYEHTFHSTKETLGIELAKLEAKVEYLKENNEAYQTIIANKENEINRLVSVINSLTKIKK